MDESSVQVVLRIRPPGAREIIDGCQICTSVTPNQPQVLIGGSHGFTFDYVLDSDVGQENVFPIVKPLVDGCLQGYNATILAYGQTGSGKTYTMGTGFDAEHNMSANILPSQGILPRSLHHLFEEIHTLRQTALDMNEPPPRVTVKAQFVELYNEEINDLMDSFDLKSNVPVKSGIKIHEDTTGGIYLVGVGTREVNSTAEALTCLRDGALMRSTASTNMNDSSSRSHAVFTLHIFQQRLIKSQENEDVSNEPEFENLSAKFHFVDLAGSERLKRTGAVGDRAKEGISINCGLLALGNVISALGDKSKKALHVPYRDSKLTRLLQDSLGGNSRTVMIACVSPCDRDFVETLSTLKYANRARNIKNKVTINQDKSSRIISSLRMEVSRLEAELLAYKQGKREVTANGESESDFYQENLLLNAELEKLRNRVKALQETVDRVTASNAELIAEKSSGAWSTTGETPSSDFSQLIRKYTQDIEELRGKLYESEATCDILKRKQMTVTTILNQSVSPRSRIPMTGRPETAEFHTPVGESVSDLIATAKNEIQSQEKHKTKLLKRLRTGRPKKDRRDSSPGGDVSLSEESLESTDGSEREEGSEKDDEDEEEGATQEEIASITDQINTKQRLIAQLELSNKRAMDTKEQYEQQITILVTKIKHTEEERDNILSSFKPSNSATTGKVKQIKEEYEAKLSSIQRDLNRMKEALKEHNHLVKKNAATEKQVSTLKSEVDSMKRLKVKLQNQLREENVKFREAEAKRQKEILQLKKDQRRKEVQIRALETKDRLKEQILKRKHEEVTSLKKQSKSNLSRRAAGKLPAALTHKRFTPANSKAKKKWVELKSSFAKTVSDRKALEQLESEMLMHIDSRKKVKDEIDELLLQKEKNSFSEEEINRLNDEIDSLTASLKYSDEQISQNQRAICELTSLSPKMEERQMPDISLAMEHFTTEDCEYLMKKMYEYTMENLSYFKDTATKLSIAEQSVEMLTRDVVNLTELLSHVYTKYCMNDPNLTPDLSTKIMNLKKGGSRVGAGTYVPKQIRHEEDETIQKQDFANGSEAQGNQITSKNARYPVSPTSSNRRTFVRRQILVEDEKETIRGAGTLASKGKDTGIEGEISAIEKDEGFVRPAPVIRHGPLSRSNSVRLPGKASGVGRQSVQEALNTTFSSIDSTQNNSTGVFLLSKPSSGIPTASRKLTNPKLIRPNTAPTTGTFQIPTESISNSSATFLVDPTTSGTLSAPGSPNASRKTVNENVFQRLTSSTSGAGNEPSTQVGMVRAIREKSYQKSALQLTHLAEGHSKAVLDLCVTENRLFTGAKDSTVKVWDLNEMREITTLFGPPSSISSVRFQEESNLLFCASACYVRVYDLRRNLCINTLSSAGICHSAQPPSESYLQFPIKEQHITSIALSPASNSLYTSYGQMVRLWDLRSFTSFGVITGKHQSNVMCMAAETVNGVTTLVTGSKDHCIKVYKYLSKEPMLNIAVSPKATLTPPHYDGIESFALSGSTLFSGSRDNCIKKWDLSAKPEFVVTYNNAHTNWITGLCLAPSNNSYLVSASRDGSMKVWNTESGTAISQIEAHKGGVNCLGSNSSAVFTGSVNGQLKFWRVADIAFKNSFVFTPQKRPLVNRFLQSSPKPEDIMTMSTGRAYGLDDGRGTIGFWKVRQPDSSEEGSPVLGPGD